jgi:hypothetical protein
MNIITSTAVDMKKMNQQTSIARQQIDEHIPEATNKQAAIKILLGYNDGNGSLGPPQGYITRIPDQLE